MVEHHPTRDMPTELAQELGIRIHDSDGTSYPFWLIVRRTEKGNLALEPEGGVWLSRPDAEAHLRNRRHAYHRDAFVYCLSGHQSPAWRKLSNALRRPALASEVPDV